MLFPVLSRSGGRPQSFTPGSLSGLLGEYDFLISGGELSTVLYDRKPGGGANGIVKAGATYSSGGVTPGGGTGWPEMGVASNAAKTIIVALKPNGGNVFASSALTDGLTPLYCDFSTSTADRNAGHLGPRCRDLGPSAANITARHNPPSWPFTLAYTFGNPGKQYVNGVPATLYDAQSNGSSFSVGTATIAFGPGFTLAAVSASLFCYAIAYDTAKSDAEMLLLHDYIMAKVNSRGITVGGPAVLTGNLVVLTGNSITNDIPLASITPSLTFDKIKVGFGNASPSQVIQIARQATQPIRRPLGTRNYLVLWPTPNTASANDVDDYVVPYAAEMRALGWKVVVPTALSHNGFDTLKNQINARYDTLMGGGTPPFDALVDLRPRTNISADGAYSNTTYYNVDGVHLTTTSYTSYVCPDITAAIDALG